MKLLSFILKSSVTRSYIGLSMNFLARLVGICADFTAHKSVCIVCDCDYTVYCNIIILRLFKSDADHDRIHFKVMLSLLYW